MSQEPQTDSIEKIGPYHIQRKLGQGAMGAVYLAVQEALEREVAIKVLAPQLAAEQDFRERFVREAKSCAKVVHPNVIACYDFGEEDGHYYMVLELAAGGDLSDLINSGPVDEQRALHILRDSARGVEAIAEAGLVHRDLKPANIFLDNSGVAKIADLGLARMSSGDDSLTMAGTIMGSPAYMSPEQARGDDDLDIRSDIYALGATLYHLVSGHPPFESGTPMATLNHVLHDEPQSLLDHNSALSSELVNIVECAMKKDREGRYTKPEQMAHDIDCLLQGLPLRFARQVGEVFVIPVETEAVPEEPETNNHEVEALAAEAMAPGPVETKPDSRRILKPIIKPREVDISEKDLEKLLRRIHIDELGVQAWMNLAPGANFPLRLLKILLECSGITYGVDQAAMQSATMTAKHPRRIVFAQGDAPSPSFAGRSVFGDEIPPLDIPIMIRCDPLGMQAVALFAPSALVPREAAKAEILRRRVCFGINKQAVNQLHEGPAEASGRLIIARGQKPQDEEIARFKLVGEVENTTIQNFATADLHRVSSGDTLAHWQEGTAPCDGMDVFGRKIPAKRHETRKPEEFAGVGTEITRSPDGSLILRASCDGLCQQQIDYSIRVVEAVDIPGDLEPSNGPIITDELVIVRGAVKEGAVIQSTSDVVICGDLEDAEIQTSGNIDVRGDIKSGEQPIVAAEEVRAEGVDVRKVMAGSIAIKGTVRNSELVATGDIEVEQVIGGRLIAGGCIHAQQAGDETRLQTELWAGHNIDYEQQGALVKVTEKKLTVERKKLVDNERKLFRQVDEMEHKLDRLRGAAYVDKIQARKMRAEEGKLRREQEQLERQCEESRKELERKRLSLDRLENLEHNTDATVGVSVKAYRGVVVKLATGDAQKIGKGEEGPLDISSHGLGEDD